MKLEADLVPTGTWGANLRSILPQVGWDRLRRSSYEDANHVCEICGSSGLEQGRKHAVECHEVWLYDDVAKTQYLAGVQSLCPYCHMVKHYGRSLKVGASAVVRKHIAEVNEWSEDTVKLYEDFIFKVHALRSQFRWTVDVMEFLEQAHAQGRITDRDLAKAKENIKKGSYA